MRHTEEFYQRSLAARDREVALRAQQSLLEGKVQQVQRNIDNLLERTRGQMATEETTTRLATFRRELDKAETKLTKTIADLDALLAACPACGHEVTP